MLVSSANWERREQKTEGLDWDVAEWQRRRFYVLFICLGPQTLIMKVLFTLMVQEETMTAVQTTS